MRQEKRQARIDTIKKLYEVEFQNSDLNLNSVETSMNKDSFFLFSQVFTHKDNIDLLIKKHSHHWKIHRIGSIELNILRVAIYELLFNKKFESNKIYINEAIEIAKIYGEQDAPKFINGILDAIIKTEKRVSDV